MQFSATRFAADHDELMILTVNYQTRDIDVDPDTPLLWILRDTLGLTGTRYGCGRGLCGACTVHVDGHAVRSCSVSVSTVSGRSIKTIEGLAEEGSPHVVQEAWVEADVPQCGFCQSGQIMQTAAMLAEDPNPSRAKIVATMNGILCRCGTYARVYKAIDIAILRLAKRDQ